MGDVSSKIPIVVPAAGESARYSQHTRLPKGLVRFSWRGRNCTMIEHVVGIVSSEQSVMVACRENDANLFRERLPRNFEVVPLVSTRGQAETISKTIGGVVVGPVVVVNCDNAFRPSDTLSTFVNVCYHTHVDLGAMTFVVDREAADLYTYGYVDDHPWFTKGVERTPISRFALAGAFYFYDAGRLSELIQELHAYRALPLFLSAVFEQYRNACRLSHVIPRSSLSAWGTSNDLVNDLNVTDIEWE